MFYAYILKSINYPEQYYVGYTNDLKDRLERHNKGYVKHTSKFMPWRLHAYFAFQTKELATNFEKYLKTGSGIAFRNKHFK